jgi:hypothetical protein
MTVSSPQPPETDVESEELVMIASSSSWVLTIAAHTSQSHPSLSVSRRLQAKKKFTNTSEKKDRSNLKKNDNLSLSLSLFLCLPCLCACVRVCLSLSHTRAKPYHGHKGFDVTLFLTCSLCNFRVVNESPPRTAARKVRNLFIRSRGGGGGGQLCACRFTIFQEHCLVVRYNHPPPNTHE